MDPTTQLGGSYRLENHALFSVKKKLQAAEITVRHPMTDELMRNGDVMCGYNPEAWSKEEVELDQLGAIATCDVHIVCNELGAKKGYIDPDSARHMAYALLKSKPIILLHEPTYDPETDKRIVQILDTHKNRYHIFDLQNEPPEEVQVIVQAVIRSTVDYSLTAGERAFIQMQVQKYIRKLT